MNDETSLREKVVVLSVFGGGLHPCKPVKFKRASGREIQVSEIGLVYPALRGRREIHIFDVSDGQADYRLEFDARTLSWYLTQEADHYER
jgi:hypothetical protein